MKLTEEQKALARQALEENIKAGYCCSESVFGALVKSGVTGLPESAVALTAGLCAGAGGTGNTCGALTGAVMGLSAVYGRRDPIGERARMMKDADKTKAVNDPKQDYRYYMMRRFNNIPGDFKKEYGTVNCRDLLERVGGYQSPERPASCQSIMRTALEIALKYIDMDQPEADALPFADNIFGWE